MGNLVILKKKAHNYKTPIVNHQFILEMSKNSRIKLICIAHRRKRKKDVHAEENEDFEMKKRKLITLQIYEMKKI